MHKGEFIIRTITLRNEARALMEELENRSCKTSRLLGLAIGQFVEQNGGVSAAADSIIGLYKSWSLKHKTEEEANG